jgi:hypothetical protein
MSSFVRHSCNHHQIAHFLFTVELDPVPNDLSVTVRRDLADVTNRLVGLFDVHRLPATWAVSDPAFSAATSLVMRSAISHEMAILGDTSWLGETAGRTRFARELERRVTKSRSVGINVVSLVPRVESIERHVDLVVKQGITAIAGVDRSAVRLRSMTPRALHYGVWEVPATIRLPQESTWFLSSWLLRRRLRQAALQAATVHLVIDASSLAEAGVQAEKTLASVAEQVAELCKRGAARVETLGAVAARLANVPNASPQQSILRRAA